MSPIFAISPENYHPHAPRVTIAGVGYRAPLKLGEAGTKQTVDLMRKLVDQAVSDQQFVRTAIEIVRGVLPYNDVAEAQAIYMWVQRNIRYTKDPVTKEKLYPPQELLKIRAGDCDDISMLIGALGIALGYPARLITIAANPDSPEEFTHVYPELEVPPGSGQWLPLDAARADAQFGVEPPYYFRKRAWSLVDNTSQDLRGCACGGNCDSSRTKLSGLSGVATIGAFGQDGTDYTDLLSQTIAETPALIAAASGQPSKYASGSTVVSTGPYASFATPYTPGSTVPYAGYEAPTAQMSANWPMLLLLGVGALLLLGKR